MRVLGGFCGALVGAAFVGYVLPVLLSLPPNRPIAETNAGLFGGPIAMLVGFLGGYAISGFIEKRR